MKLSVIVILVALAAPAAARPVADPELAALHVSGGLTADTAVQRARHASPAVWRKVAELEGAIASVEAAKLGRIPQITSKLSYTRLSKLDDASGSAALGTLSFPQLLDNYAAQTQIVVPLSDQVLRHPNAIRSAKLAAASARAGVQATEQEVAIAARRAYYEWIRARLQHVISVRQLAQVRASLRQVRALVAAQRLSKVDLLRIESQEAEAEQLADRLGTLAALREEVLRLQIGASAAEPLAIGEDISSTIAAPAERELDDLVHEAKLRRPDLAALRLAAEANEQRRIAEQANRYPKLSAFAASEYSNPNQRVFPQDDKFTWSWSAGVQLTFTLNDALISRTTDRKIAAEGRALRADREAASRDARIAVLAAQHDVANAQNALRSTSKGLAAAEEGYRVRRALLDAERATAVELVDAETDLTRARISALDARIDLRIAIAELASALGRS